MSKVSLPPHVHRIKSRGREYFYYQEGRGTPQVGERIRLPNNPQTPEFWEAVRQAQGSFGPTATDTIGALIDAYVCSWPSLQRKLTDGTQKQYRRNLEPVRMAWGGASSQRVATKTCGYANPKNWDEHAGCCKQCIGRSQSYVQLGEWSC